MLADEAHARYCCTAGGSNHLYPADKHLLQVEDSSGYLDALAERSIESLKKYVVHVMCMPCADPMWCGQEVQEQRRGTDQRRSGQGETK
jgi:hypothetical protein